MAEICASCLSGVVGAVVVDLDAVEQVRRRAAGAHGRELGPGGLDGLLHPARRLVEEVLEDARRSSAPHHGPHALAAHYPVDVALVVHVEDVDRQVVVHAERQRGRVHHLQALLDRLLVGDLLDEASRRGPRAGRRV